MLSQRHKGSRQKAQRLPSEGTKAPIERHKGFRGKADWMRMKGTEAATEADNR